MDFIIIAPGCEPKQVSVEVEPQVDGPKMLQTMQALVGGSIEIIYPNQKLEEAGLDVYGNEEGKLTGCPPNIRLDYDVLVGTLLVTRHSDDGDTLGVKKGDLEIVKDWVSSANRPRYGWGL